MILRYSPVPGWPPLSWVAECSRNSEIVTVLHGPKVECHPEWFCEAAWDGPFTDGNFDQTDLIFGSGGRIRRGSIIFVSAGSTLDRLQSIQLGDRVLVSNSLICLIEAADAKLDVTDPEYSTFFHSICHGIDQYTHELNTSRGPVRFTYFRNVRWNGNTLGAIDKPTPERDFGSFARYFEFMQGALSQIVQNASSSLRRFPFRILGTMSSGYDSLAVCCIARDLGLRHAISFRSARHGDSDFNAAFAERLGMELSVFERLSYRSKPLSEVPFIAADGKGEDVVFSSAATLLNQTLLLTGTYGDSVWNMTPAHLCSQIKRGARTGLSLTDYRLQAGFIHFPVPVMGIAQIKDINGISRSTGMAQWDYTNPAAGSLYSRPIARRIIEEAGIPRDQFAVTKKAVAVLFSGVDSLSPDTLDDYLSWLQNYSDHWTKKHLQAPYPPTLVQKIKGTLAAALGSGLYGISSFDPHRLQLIRNVSIRCKRASRLGLDRYMFPWAIERSRRLYRRPATSLQIDSKPLTTTCERSFAARENELPGSILNAAVDVQCSIEPETSR